MADHSSENSTAAETVNSDLDATRPGTDAATLRGSSGADETSKNVTTSGQDVPEDQQGSTTAGVADGANGEAARVAASDVKNIILQVLSPYFDDDVGGGAAAGPGGDLAAIPSASGPSPPAIEEDRDGDDTAQRYDHFKAEEWVALVCDGIMERLVALGKPFKFVVHAMVMRKCGAGVHVCSSCYYAPMDGWLSHAHDLSAHLYAVVTVYWCAV
ncbi:Tctex-1 family protein [Leishmania donovani]|uniref:Tctex-1 family protein n=1 Tax=Leishmania donovani TaxID=5661 RepID=A0A504Y4Z0_LEIDO|nr:Tctex-1 family protein [Leishmania donovani]